MKFLIQWLLVLLTVLNPIISRAALTDFDRQELAVKNWLAPYNSGFESGVAKWTASGGSLAAVTSGSNLLTGKGSATWDSSSASQTLTSQTITIEKGYYGQNCEAALRIQTPSGTATHTIQAYDGTNILVSATVTSSTLPALSTINFPCPSSGTVALRLVSVNANEPLVAIDDAYLGLARNIGSTQLISEWTSYTPTGSWTSNTTYTGKWRQLGDTAEVQVRLALSGAPTAASLTVNLPSGLVIDTSKLAGGTTQVELPNSDGSMRDDASYNGFVKAFYDSTTSVGIRSPSTATAHTLVIVNSTTPITWAANDSIDVTFRVPIVGWTAQTVVMPDAQGWYVDASISGANPSLGTSSVSSYTGIENGSLTMTQNSGSAAVQIGCSSTNAPSGLTCSSGNESLSVAFTPPKSGAYRVCVEANHYIDAPAGSINVASTFQLVETATNSQTIIQEGRGKAMSGSVAMSGDRREYRSVATCGDFVLSAGAQRMIRLMYETEISGTPDNHHIKADGGVTLGQPDVHWTVYPLQSPASAILANSVSTGTTNGEKIERVKLNLSGATTVSITNQSTGWLQSVTASGTVPTLTFTPGWFSAEPTCQVTCSTNVTNVFGVGVPNGTTGINIACIDILGAVRLSNAIAVTCMGPR